MAFMTSFCDPTDRRRLALRALDTVDQIGAARSLDALYRVLQATFSSLGFEHFIISGIPTPTEKLERAVVLRNWPAEWFGMYARENFVRDDPTVKMCHATTMPFEWRDAPIDPCDKGAQDVMNFARDFGLLHGFSLPIHAADGSVACVSLGGRNPDLDSAVKPALHLMGIYAFEQARRLIPNALVRPLDDPLTNREKEVLTWAAIGKLHSEIAEIMGITERTVTAHSNHATNKLGAANKTQAVVKALQANFIRL